MGSPLPFYLEPFDDSIASERCFGHTLLQGPTGVWTREAEAAHFVTGNVVYLIKLLTVSIWLPSCVGLIFELHISQMTTCEL